MKIFLIILASLLSYVGTLGLFLKGALDMILIFPKKGYILNTEKLDEQKKKIQNINVQSKSAILLCVPILNMIYTSYLMHKVNKSVFEEMKKYPGALIPMTEDERKEFKNTKGVFKKIEYFMELAENIQTSNIIDVEAYEVIEDEEKQEQPENDLLNKYKNLRDEVNSINQELTEQDNQTFSRIL